MKKTKIKLNHFSGEYSKDEEYYDKYFPLKVLRDNFNVEFVEDINEADIIFEHCTRASNYEILKEKNKKVILISSEDLLKKRDVFNLIESFVHKFGFKNKKWKIMDKIDSIIPHFISSIPLVYFLPKHLKYIKKISRGKIKNAYAIIQNNIQGDNIFIVPSFFHVQYYQMPKLIKKREGKNIKRKKKFCSFFVSSNSSRERVKFFRMLSKYKKIDSYGKVLNNMGGKMFGKHWNKNRDIFKEYKFVICFENSFRKKYITEKLPNAMLSGAIPIYRGAPDIGDYFNKKSFINYDDYGSYRKMIKKIIELDNDDNKYAEMMQIPRFKNNKLPEIFKEKEKKLIEFYKKILNS